MSLFGNWYLREGPGVQKDAPQKKGVARYFEMFGRDFFTIWRVSLLTTLCFLPCFFAVVVCILFWGYWGVILAAAVLYLLGAMLAGPTLCGLHAVILNIVRDKPAYLMHTFKKAWKQNWRQSVPAGLVLMVLLALESTAGAYFLLSSDKNVWMLSFVFLALIVIFGCGLMLFLQMLFLDLPLFPLLKNSVMLEFGYLKRTLPATFILMGSFLVAALYCPWPLLGLLLLAGTPGLLVLWADMLAWPVMEAAFQITQRQNEKTAEEDACS